jgi:hypothetical protein
MFHLCFAFHAVLVCFSCSTPVLQISRLTMAAKVGLKGAALLITLIIDITQKRGEMDASENFFEQVRINVSCAFIGEAIRTIRSAA